jgi:hypothetical protein
LINSILRSPIASIVTDPNADDNPIIAANSQFVKLTGYTEDELLGRNCRLLAGPDTSATQSAVLRQAIAAAKPAVVELLNYRKDGTVFINAVMVAPLFDEVGKLAFFVGSQMEVTDRPFATLQHSAAERIRRLTPRQHAVLKLVAQGHRNRQIAAELGLKEKTVRIYRVAIMRRLGVATIGEAMRLGVEAGL